MVESVAIPSWAVALLITALGGASGLAVWGLKALSARVSRDIDAVRRAVNNSGEKLDGRITELSDKIHSLDKRLVRIEVRTNGQTPPFGVPYRLPSAPPIDPEER